MDYDRDLEFKICIICGLRKTEGIKIHSGFICDTCEEEIVHTEADNERYTFFIKRMKEIWLKNA